jgi:hypothetical protein
LSRSAGRIERRRNRQFRANPALTVSAVHDMVNALE